MTAKTQNITFAKLGKNALMPYELLLLADPSEDLVEEYLKHADVFVARKNDETIGVIVLLSLTSETVEIKNIAVNPAFQGQGIGHFLIENIIRVATTNKQKRICIGTANSSIAQLYLYQKLGFEINEIRMNFFTENYTEPIYENGIQAKHLLLMTRELIYETSMPQIAIRKGEIDDLTELQQIFVDTVSSVCSADYDAEQIKVWTSSVENRKHWEDIMTNQFVLVAQIGNKMVGFASLDKGNYIDLLYVHKDHQNQGIARKLYSNIENAAKQQGQTALESDVSKTAKIFFEKIGFKVINEQIVMRQGVELTNFKMRKGRY